MEKKRVNGLILYYEPADSDSAELVGEACRKTILLLREAFALDPPADCRVYLMTSWRQFMLQSPPWPWKFLLAATMPVWIFRIKAIWPYVGGWEQRYGRRYAVGIKPPRLIEISDRSIGVQIFIPEEDVREKVRHITCHELTHAITEHLGLPVWLKEGLAMRMVDRFAGKPTVRPDSLRLLEQTGPDRRGVGQERIDLRDQSAVVRLYARGYWLTRFLEDMRPDLLKALLQKRHSHRQIEEILASAFQIPTKEFWYEINRVAVSHFQGKDNPA